MKAIIILVLVVCCVLGLKTLKKEEIQGKYEIGTIQNLYFRIEDKIFFRSDDDVFGFISQKDGSLLQVYELEDDQQIINFVKSYEVVVSKNKNLNIFLTPNSVYKPLTAINKYLSNHSDYSTIVDFLRTGSMTVYILTNKFLLQIQFHIQQRQYQQKILVELTNKSETFIGLVPFLNVGLGKEDVYLISRVQDSSSNICFRKVSDVKSESTCFKIQKDPIIDIVDSSDFIYIQFEKYALAFSTDLRYIAKIESKPLHYFNGLISLSETHQFYDPSVKTTYDTIIIVEHETVLPKNIKTLKIQQKAMIVQDKDKQNFIDVLSIPKDSKENPRKAWSHTQKDNIKKFRLYVQFDNGVLVCYSIDRETKKSQQLWKITTTTASKVVTGEIQAKDIDGDDQQQEQLKKPIKDGGKGEEQDQNQDIDGSKP